MEKGIFHNGLKGQLRDLIVLQLSGNVKDKLCAVVVAHILQLHIQGHMGQIVPDPVGQLPPAKGQLVKTGQSLDCPGYLVGLAVLGQPVDHIQGIVEKMRVDLGLEGSEIRLRKLLGCRLLAV